jgi:hypothetical protein
MGKGLKSEEEHHCAPVMFGAFGVYCDSVSQPPLYLGGRESPGGFRALPFIVGYL